MLNRFKKFANWTAALSLAVAVAACGSASESGVGSQDTGLPTMSSFGLAQWIDGLRQVAPSNEELSKGFLFSLTEAESTSTSGTTAKELNYSVKTDMLLAMKPGQVVPLTLPGGITHEIELDRIETISLNNGKVWLGHIKGLGRAYFVNISILDNSLIGEMETPEGAYSLNGEGLKATLRTVDKTKRFHKAMAGDTDELVPEAPNGVKRPRRSLDGSEEPLGFNLPRTAATQKSDGPAVINMLAITTPEYTSSMGANAQNCLNIAVAGANQAFANSQIQLSVNLVHVASVTGVPAANFAEAALFAITPWATSVIPAVAEQVSDLRAQFAADVVVLFRPYVPGDSAGGVAWLGGLRTSESKPLVDMATQGRNAFAVVQTYSSSDCSWTADTLAHELGHNFGSQHTRAMEGTSPRRGALNSSYGHGGTGTAGQAFTTMMGYGPRVRLFSNPNLTTDCYGTYCGIASGENSADNAYGFQLIRHQIAAWRTFNKKLKLNLATTGTAVGDVYYTRPDGYTGLCNQGKLCLEYFPSDANVSLTAYNGNGAVFTGWTGACTGTSATCDVTMDAVKNVTANFANGVPLTVNYMGDPGGLIFSFGTSGGFIGCGTWSDGTVADTCTADFGPNSQVTLTAYDNGLYFGGWGGACAGALTNSCTITMDSAKTVSAQFSSSLKTLTVVKNGTGIGTVTGGAINCGAICTATYAAGTSTVTLTATASAGSTFAGWGGACSGTGSCTVTMDSAKAVTATFTLNQYNLTVSKAGTGSGMVTGGGISCGTSCSAAFTHGTSVTLTASPSAGSIFTGWSGACTGTSSCTVSMDAAKLVTGTFVQGAILTVSKTGAAGGLIYSGTHGIGCGYYSDGTVGSSCTATLIPATSVTLNAYNTQGKYFLRWGGACTGVSTATCTVTMDASKSVSAEFVNNMFLLTVSKSGSGTGDVSAGTFTCPLGYSACSTSYPEGSIVTLIASPTTGSTFTGWSGPCTGTGTCNVTLDAAKTVTATFAQTQFTLSTSKAGNGSGTISAGGINCGVTCSTALNYGTTAVLTATPSVGSVFTGWSGACSGTGSCSVTMSANKAVTATFQLLQYTLNVSKTGSGSIMGSSINCGSTCSATLNHGTMVSLSAVPDSGYTFAGWGGVCTGTGSCSISMTEAKSVTATFVPNQTLTVSKTGSGAITGTSINCGTTCSASFAQGASVTLTATPGTGAKLQAWGGACSGVQLTCTVTMDTAKAVTATFALLTPTDLQVKGVADFDGDGKADILWVRPDGQAYISQMSGNTLLAWNNLGNISLTVMGVGDFNGDGSADIVWRNMSTGAVSISLVQAGYITSWLNVGQTPIALNTKLEGIGDFDGNGRADMLWRNQTTGRAVMSYHNTDGSVASWPEVSRYIDPTRTLAQKVGDINGDGKADIVWRNAETGNVVISLMNGNVPTWKAITASPIPPSVALEAIGDFDGNGRADLLWRNTLTGRSLMSYHNPDGTVASWPVVSNYINPSTTSAQGAGDFDGDGRADILWRNLASGNTVLSLMNGYLPTWLGVSL